MVTRKTPEQIEKEILDFLFEGPKSINEIAEKIGSTWPTTNSYLEKLKKSGQVNELLATEKMKIFRRTDDPIYFSLPIKKEVRLKTLFLLKEIERIWKEQGKKSISQTAMQKIAVDVIKTYNLNLPVLQFHYGMTTCASATFTNNPSIISLITEPEDKEKLEKQIREIMKHPRHTGKATEEKEYQYEKYKLPFYQARENLVKSLVILKEKNTCEKFSKAYENLISLSATFPIRLEKFYPEFQEFISNVQIILLSKLNDPQKIEIVKETLNQLWEKLTNYTSFADSEEFIDPTKKQVFQQIKDLHANFKEMGYNQYKEELNSIAGEIDPFKVEIPSDEISNDIQSIILEGLENE
jgi:DNA-binding transcriptional ArsR family regulator